MNKELVLREYLAIERTKLVNESTLLAYIRTGLYFFVGGSTLGQIVDTFFWRVSGPFLIAIGLTIIVVGLVRYFRLSKRIEKSKQNIGNSSEAFIRSVRGNLSE